MLVAERVYHMPVLYLKLTKIVEYNYKSDNKVVYNYINVEYNYKSDKKIVYNYINGRV